ncbi:DUF192 domain-containing protein [Marinobacter sp. DUT-3]|uniref:DUF192 domain-containing protein n=1 Tax=Marinobacter sp. DUT-3 TaxID=3412036 RepID=UPI003D173F0A
MVDIQNRLPAAVVTGLSAGAGRYAGVTCLLIGCLFVLGGMAREAIAEERLPSRQACLISDKGVIPITVEMAITDSQRRKGLMGRESLPANSGMLFVYDEPRKPDHGFWMYKTLIPLDIAYLDKTGTIKAIKHMAPCRSRTSSGCPVYRAGVSFSAVLEMNRSFFRNHGISVGHHFSTSESICKH